MKLTTRILSALCFCVAAWAADGTGLNTQSDKAKGLVTLTSDLVLNDGRLIFKVAAFNKGVAPATLSPAKITVTSASGKVIPLASLAQLEDETRAAYGGAPKNTYTQAQTPVMQRPTSVNESGEPELGGYTGSEGVAPSVTAVRPKKKPVVDETTSPELKAALESLRVGVLQDASVPPQSAAGGNVVTQSYKFGRKEERKLRVSVEFADERHDFDVEIPRQ